jgi:MoxR-like ATPase
VVGAAELKELQDAIRAIPVADHVYDYVLALSRGTRVGGTQPLPFVQQWVSWGAGPRASQFLILGAKAHAALAGRTHVAIEDVKAVVHPVLRHRIVTNYSAQAEGITSDIVIDRLLQEIDAGGKVGLGVPGVKQS